ncbi:integrase core domain-containing protein [Methylomarinovum tepidoasis]|uniref:integrase core domain-containing protein n=1 Tax=Methylomarinovum tepidoasis TaxID=2840183 RepID=UPI003BF552D2
MGLPGNPSRQGNQGRRRLPRPPDRQSSLQNHQAPDSGKDKSAGSGFGACTRPRRGEPQRWGEQFTDRFCATGECEPTGRCLFDQTCQRHGIEHRPIPPKRPQTNRQACRFDGRIAGLLKTTRFQSNQDLERTSMQYANVYNHQIPQEALGHISPAQDLKDWQKKRPELFKKVIISRVLTSYSRPEGASCN